MGSVLDYWGTVLEYWCSVLGTKSSNVRVGVARFIEYFSRSGHYPVIVLAYSVPTSMRRGAVSVTSHILWKRWPGVYHLVMLSLSQHQKATKR